jgi:hypothetical protein
MKLSWFSSIGNHACVEIFKHVKIYRSRSCAATKIKRTGVAKKHHIAFAPSSNGFHLQSDNLKVYINKRLIEQKVRYCENCENPQSMNVSSHEN